MRKYFLLLIVFFGLGNTALFANSDVAQAVPSNQKITIENYNDICLVSEFDEFLKRYSTELIIQENFTEYPLMSSHVVDEDSDYQKVTEMLPKEALKFPLMPLETERKEVGLELSVTRKNDYGVTVKMEKPDTGYLVYYYFAKKESCWKLVAEDDRSI